MRDGVQHGINYFLMKFNTDFYPVVRAFRAARTACPTAVQELRPTPQDVEELRRFPFLDDDGIIGDLQQELPTYLAEADGEEVHQREQLVWWKHHKVSLPYWCICGMQVSAGTAIERGIGAGVLCSSFPV